MKRLLDSKTFSRPQLAIFILAFAIIGYLVFKSFAASNPNLPGDLNNDNTVNAQDLSLLLSNYGTTNPAGDVNSDGTVNAIDLSILLSHYGSSYKAPSLTISGAWYMASSPWNTPIPAGVAIRSNNSSLISAWQSQWCPNNQCLAPSDFWGTPSFWIATNSTTLVRVEVNTPSIGCGATHNNSIMVPIPADAVVSHANDPEPVMVIMQSDTGEEWDFYKVTAPGVATVNSSPALNCPADSSWQAVIVAEHNPGWTSTGLGSSTRAAGTYSGAGTIRPRDTQAAAGTTWDHALAFVYAGALITAAPPAISSDGGCSDANSCIPEGARIQLDPSINCTTWPSLVTVPEYVRQICRTMQKYGAIIIDTANPGGALVTENSVSAESTSPNADPPHNGVRYPWNAASSTVHLPADLVPYLRVIDWTQWH